MTRFARAKGSKASNERREEEATPWHVMRQQLAEQLSSLGAHSGTDKDYNLKEILSKEDSTQKTEAWSDFGEPKPSFKGKPKEKAKKDKSNDSSILIVERNNSHLTRETVSTGGNKSSKHANKEINREEIKSVIEDKGLLKKRKSKKKNQNNKSLPQEITDTFGNVKGNKFIVESVQESNSAHKRQVQEDNGESELKSNFKRPKFDEKIDDGSRNLNVGKKNKKKKLKIKHDFTEIPHESKDSSVPSLCPTENPIELLKNNAKESLEPENSLSIKKSKKNKKGLVGKTQNNIDEISKYEENISISLNNSEDNQYKSLGKQKDGTSASARLKNSVTLTSNNKSDSKSEDFDSQKNQYRKNNYSKAYHNNSFQTIIANGREIHIVKYQGFYVKKDDAEELKKLHKKLKAQNIPKEKLETIMKLERRKAEKALAREKKKVCFHCRQFGHNFSDCPDIKESDMVKTGICFKCGSLEHSHFECKVLQNQEFRHAVCFVCKEQGHIARQCPLNSQGLYPRGGSCHLCGEVTHLRKDCPKAVEEKTTKSVTIGTLKDGTVEDISGVTVQRKGTETQKKVIKFK